MPSASWIIEQQRAEAEVVDLYRNLDAVITRVEWMESRERATADVLARTPNGNGAVALQRAEDLRQVLAIVKRHQANLDRIHLIEQLPRRENRYGGGR